MEQAEDLLPKVILNENLSRREIKTRLKKKIPDLHDILIDDLIKKGVQEGKFCQPKGPCGSISLSKVELDKYHDSEKFQKSVEMVKECIKTAIKDMNMSDGSSRQSILKYIYANFRPSTDEFQYVFKYALKDLVKSGVLSQPKGPNGSYLLANDFEKELDSIMDLFKKRNYLATFPEIVGLHINSHDETISNYLELGISSGRYFSKQSRFGTLYGKN